MGSEGSWSLTACSALTNSPTGCVGRSVVRITIISPSPRRSLDHALGWEHLRGDKDVPYLTGRASFREVLLKDRLRDAIRRVKLGEDGETWLDDARVEAALSALERVSGRLMEANETATHLLLKGTVVEGDPDLHGGHNQTVHYIDFDHPERNDFLVVDQFRADAAGRDPIIPDLILFVNGIPL